MTFADRIARTPTWTSVIVLLGAMALGSGAMASPAAKPSTTAATRRALPPVSAKQVGAAMARATAYLYSIQEDGRWEQTPAADPKGGGNNYNTTGGQWGGRTALACYALLSAGESPQNAKLKPAIEFLKKAEIKGTYALAMRCQVWLLLPRSSETKALMQRDAKALLSGVRTRGPAAGLNDYTIDAKGDGYSLSRSQYCTLGLWAAAKVGVEIPDGYWKLAEAAWLKHQDKDGGWSYIMPGVPALTNRPAYPSTVGMTAAGVATMYIIEDMLYRNASIDCRGSRRNQSIERGVKWLEERFPTQGCPEGGSRGFPWATLYSVERVGVSSGMKYFGDADWFAQGARWLLSTQKPEGNWTVDQPGVLFNGLPDACFAILFFSRGHAPLVMNKLDYNLTVGGRVNPADWNERPRDVAGLVEWMTDQSERWLNFQNVNLLAPPEDLLDAPLLYIAGRQSLSFTDEQKAKLKAYVELGGLIVANADCAAKPFADSVKQLGGELFPAYEWRELPADHLIFNTLYNRASWKSPPSVLALGNGARELMVLFPQDDPSRAWQMKADRTKPELFQVAANLFYYVAGRRDLRMRGESHIVSLDPKVNPTSTLRVARLKYGGNWDPEPGGWRRLATMMHNQDKVRLEVQTAELGQGSLDPKSCGVAHMTGTGKFALRDAQKQEILKFIAGGGILIVDAAGGDSAFADAAEAELKAMFPDAPRGLVPPESAVFASVPDSGTVSYRAFAKSVGARTTPLVQSITVGQRIAVYYSREDLSVGLVGHSVDGIYGYSPPSACNVMRAMLLSTATVKTPLK